MSKNKYAPNMDVPAKSKVGAAMREAYASKNEQRGNWGELDGIYVACAQSLVGTLQHVTELVSHPDVVANLAHIGETEVLVKGIKRDIHTFTSDLVKIKARHEGKRGEIRSDEDLLLSIGIHQDYSMFNEMFRTTITPNILTLTDQIANAINSLSVKSAVASATLEGDSTPVLQPVLQ